MTPKVLLVYKNQNNNNKNTWLPLGNFLSLPFPPRSSPLCGVGLASVGHAGAVWRQPASLLREEKWGFELRQAEAQRTGHPPWKKSNNNFQMYRDDLPTTDESGSFHFWLQLDFKHSWEFLIQVKAPFLLNHPTNYRLNETELQCPPQTSSISVVKHSRFMLLHKHQAFWN